MEPLHTVIEQMSARDQIMCAVLLPVLFMAAVVCMEELFRILRMKRHLRVKSRNK